MVVVILAVIVAVTFTGTGGVKLFSLPASLKIRDSLDVDPGRWRMIGTLEWLGAVGVLVGLAWWPVGLAACVGLAALMIGAVVTRIAAARRHQRSELLGVLGDLATLALVAATAVAFVAQA